MDLIRLRSLSTPAMSKVKAVTASSGLVGLAWTWEMLTSWSEKTWEMAARIPGRCTVVMRRVTGRLIFVLES